MSLLIFSVFFSFSSVFFPVLSVFSVFFRFFRFFPFFPFLLFFFQVPIFSLFFLRLFPLQKKKRGDTLRETPFCETPN